MGFSALVLAMNPLTQLPPERQVSVLQVPVLALHRQRVA